MGWELSGVLESGVSVMTMHPACVSSDPRQVYKACERDCGCRVESCNSYTRSMIAAALNQPPPRALWSCGPGICSDNSDTTEGTHFKICSHAKVELI